MGTFTASDRQIKAETLKVICDLLGYGPDAVLDIVIDARRVDVHLLDATAPHKKWWIHHAVDWTEVNSTDQQEPPC